MGTILHYKQRIQRIQYILNIFTEHKYTNITSEPPFRPHGVRWGQVSRATGPQWMMALHHWNAALFTLCPEGTHSKGYYNY